MEKEKSNEITSKMVETGALALTEHDMQLETPEEGAVRIFLAMISQSADHFVPPQPLAVSDLVRRPAILPKE